MRRYRKKFIGLVFACGLLPAFFLQCDKAGLNIQRGFWQGLGFNLSTLITTQLQLPTP